MEKELSVGLRVSLLHRAFRKKMDEMLSEKELTGAQLGVLGALVRLERSGAGEVSQRALEQATRLGHPTVTEIVKRLEKKGFLHCETSSRDRRFKSISSTEKALRLEHDVKRVEEDTFRWLCRGLTPEESERFLSLMDRMLENVRADCSKGCEAEK